MKNLCTTYYFYFLCFWFYSLCCIAQQDNALPLAEKDTLAGYSYQEISDKIYSNYYEKKQNLEYSKYLINRYKKEKNKKLLIKAYLLFLNYNSDYNLTIKYTDSILNIAETKIAKQTLLQILNFKSNENYKNKEYIKCLKTSIIANKIALELRDIKNQLISNSRIATIKELNQDYHSAIRLFLKNLQLNKEEYKYYDWYLQRTMYGIAFNYNQLEEIDSSLLYTKKGLKIKNNEFEVYFKLNLGELYYKKKDYTNSIKLINQTLDTLKNKNDHYNLSEAYYYLGLNYAKIKPKDSIHINYFKKLDSLFIINNDLFPKMRLGYHDLVSYYKSKNSFKAIYYSKQLNTYDSLINIRQKELNKTIYEKYEIPNRIRKEKTTIYNLEKKQSYFLFAILSLILICSIYIFLYYKQFKKALHYKKRAKELLESKITKTTSKKRLDKKNIKTTYKKDISDTLYYEILQKLNLFEKQKGFINTKISLNSLATTLGTNSKYISQIINKEKDKNFKNYINELRIKFAVQELKENPTYLKYTIKAIAEEFGFNTSESFANAFVKYTGTKPSYYIKELKKEKNLDF